MSEPVVAKIALQSVKELPPMVPVMKKGQLSERKCRKECHLDHSVADSLGYIDPQRILVLHGEMRGCPGYLLFSVLWTTPFPTRMIADDPVQSNTNGVIPGLSSSAHDESCRTTAYAKLRLARHNTLSLHLR